jgi:hypothetical protein
MSLEADARAVAAKAGTLKEKRDRVVRRILGRERDTVDAYRALFLTGDELSPAALIVLRDLALFGGLGRDLSAGDEVILRRQSAVRATIQHMLGRFDLDEKRIARLVRQLSDRTPPSEIHSLQNGEQA